VPGDDREPEVELLPRTLGVLIVERPAHARLLSCGEGRHDLEDSCGDAGALLFVLRGERLPGEEVPAQLRLA